MSRGKRVTDKFSGVNFRQALNSLPASANVITSGKTMALIGGSSVGYLLRIIVSHWPLESKCVTRQVTHEWKEMNETKGKGREMRNKNKQKRYYRFTRRTHDCIRFVISIFFFLFNFCNFRMQQAEATGGEGIVFVSFGQGRIPIIAVVTMNLHTSSAGLSGSDQWVNDMFCLNIYINRGIS